MVIWIILLLYLIKIYQVLVCSWILQIQKIQVPWSHLSVHQHRSSCQSLARRVLPPHCRMVRHQHRIRCLVPHGILHVKLPWIRYRLLDPLRSGGGGPPIVLHHLQLLPHQILHRIQHHLHHQKLLRHDHAPDFRQV
jgi:hypothetical protein